MQVALLLAGRPDTGVGASLARVVHWAASRLQEVLLLKQTKQVFWRILLKADASTQHWSAARVLSSRIWIMDDFNQDPSLVNPDSALLIRPQNKTHQPASQDPRVPWSSSGAITRRLPCSVQAAHGHRRSSIVCLVTTFSSSVCSHGATTSSALR